MRAQGKTGKMHALHMPTTSDRNAGNTHAPASRKNAATGLFSGAASAPSEMPPEMQLFVQSLSVTEAATALQLSRRAVYRLRQGYWPDDARRLTRAWAAYKGRAGRVDSGWFLRRVRAGGYIRHAGRDWAAPGLAAHADELVAVARTPGGLLAQTLELPVQRLALEPLGPASQPQPQGHAQ